MVGIITKHAIKCGITILQTSHVYRYDSNSRRERLLILYKQTTGTCDTTDKYINSTSNFVDIINNFELYICIVLETFDE